MKQILISTLWFSVFFTVACNRNNQNEQATSGSYYTCPMHPTVVSNSPGSCPVCNMSLVKIEKKTNQLADYEGNFVTIDRQKQELAGIKTDTVSFRNILPSATLTGTVTIDEEQVRVISSRVKGRIDSLFVKTTGVYLKSGSPVYSIYSEKLQADKKEYLSLFEKSNTADATAELTKEFAEAAKNKLLLWDLSEQQISDLEKSGKASPLITFYSSEAGYVTEVNITEGMYVEEGSTLLKITSLHQVWVEAQIYPNEVSSITENKSFQVFSENNPEEVYTGKLAYSNPVIEEGKRIYLLKIRVNNSKGNLIPGTLVSVLPEKSSANVLAVPKSAVLLEKMKTVWVLVNENTYEQRMVETGIENNYWIEIKSGLQQGEVVVSEGAYLINSEFILHYGAGQRHEH